ncbi:MAG: DUF421 domain-containing protein [Clostridiales bacterium]|nr:DUF421 domain-containing protein [Clostridiales bacterium]
MAIEMIVTILRTLILYLLIICGMRLMGKRQVGELQPTELVITILLSEIAAIPMQDNALPLLSAIIPVLLLVAFELIISAASFGNVKIRSWLEGNPLIVIRNGKLDQPQLRRLRYSVDDVLEALREKGVFDISTVQYAVAETNGTLSILLKPEERPASAGEAGIKTRDNGIPCAVIVDGKIMETEFKDCGMTHAKLENILKKHSLKVDNLVLLSADKNGGVTIIEKEDKKK